MTDAAPRVLFLWSRVSGYMAACWRALQATGTFEPYIRCVQAVQGDPSAPPFGQDVMDGLTWNSISHAAAEQFESVAEQVREVQPAVVVVAGWRFRGYAAWCRAAGHRRLPVVLGIDNPWRGDWRQRLGYWRVRALLKRADRIAVPGECGAELMKFWRVPDGKVWRGLYGIDYRGLEPCLAERQRSGGWPPRFLYVGRLDERKGVDLLLEAYARYRQEQADPWELRVVGRGPLGSAVANAAGVSHSEYVAPRALAAEMTRAGAFVLASRYDAWPLVLVEAAAAGLPLIASAACGSAREIVLPGRSGMVVPTGAVASLTAALRDMSALGSQLPVWGAAGQRRAEPYSAEQWAARWSAGLRQLLETSHNLRER